MIYINEGEMCFIPMNVHNELLNGVRQLRWQHLSPVVSLFSTSGFYPPFHKALQPLSLSVHLSLSFFCGTHPVFLIIGLSLLFGDVAVLFLQSKEEEWYCMRKSGLAEKYVRIVQDM